MALLDRYRWNFRTINNHLWARLYQIFIRFCSAVWTAGRFPYRGETFQKFWEIQKILDFIIMPTLPILSQWSIIVFDLHKRRYRTKSATHSAQQVLPQLDTKLTVTQTKEAGWINVTRRHWTSALGHLRTHPVSAFCFLEQKSYELGSYMLLWGGGEVLCFSKLPILQNRHKILWNIGAPEPKDCCLLS